MSNWSPRPLSGVHLHKQAGYGTPPNPDDSSTRFTNFAEGSWGSMAWGATPHVATAWREIWASTPQDLAGLQVRIDHYSSGLTHRVMFDVAVGGAGSEVPIIENLLLGGQGAYRSYVADVRVPVFIPRGSRVSMRWRGSIAWPASEQPIAAVGLDGYGFSAGAVPFVCRSRATFLADPSTTNSTMTSIGGYGVSAWQELIASAPFRIKHLVLSSADQAAAGGNPYIYDLAIGAAGSEVLHRRGHNTQAGWAFDVPVDVPRGARLAIRVYQGAQHRYVAHAYG